MSMLFGGVRQVGYVVRDIEKAMAHWSRTLGVGPWFYKEEVGTTRVQLLRQAVAPAAAVDRTGQLRRPADRADPATRRRPVALPRLVAARRRRRAALAYWTDTGFDDTVTRLLSVGYVEGHSGRMGARGRFAYFVHPDLPSGMFEISEMAGGKGEYFRTDPAGRRRPGTAAIRSGVDSRNEGSASTDRGPALVEIERPTQSPLRSWSRSGELARTAPTC